MQTVNASRQRWDEMLCSLAGLLPAGPASVLVDGPGEQPAVLAIRLAAALNASGRAGVKLHGAEPDGADSGDTKEPHTAAAAVRVADSSCWRELSSWDVVIWARTAPAVHGARNGDSHAGGEERADIVIDLHDPDWPVIRRVAAPLAARGPWYLIETRAFFACRAATWDTKFGDDLPSYAAAVAEAGIRAGGVVIDVGCGTGRALPPLRQAVGPTGTVIAVDRSGASGRVTPARSGRRD